MKKLCSLSFAIIVLFVVGVSVSYAQKRKDETKISSYSGPIIKKKDPSQGADLGNLFNVKMHQSFSASVSTFGGNVMNTEAFTNSMQFFFSKKLTGQVDVSLLTSPFTQIGNNNFYGFKDNRNLQVALDAQLNYKINKNMDIHLEINRTPARYGYYPGSRYSRFGVPAFQSDPVLLR